MIPLFNDLKERSEIEETKRKKLLLKEFNDFMEGRFPIQGTLSSPCPDKFLSVCSLIREEYIKRGWDIDFEVKTSCGQIVCSRVIIKGIK